MADNYALLAHVARGFVSGTENAATEALAHILNRSANAREGLDDLIRSGVENVEAIVRVRTQVVGSRGTIPDLVGFDGDGKERVLVEVKFWADLTAGQPNYYLDRLPGDGPAVLLFLVPDERIRRLWPVLRKRLAGARLSDLDSERKCVRVDDVRVDDVRVDDVRVDDVRVDDVRVDDVRVDDGERHLMVSGWTGLLDCMATRARDAGEHDVEADIRQLRGLAEYAHAPQDGPAGPGAEASALERHLRRIIDAATDHGVGAGWLDRKGLVRTRRWYGYGRFVRFSGSGAEPWFGINRDLYKRNGETLLWLQFGRPAQKRGWVNQVQFDALRRECGLREEDGWVPLVAKEDDEFSEVLEDVLAQLTRISEVIDGAA